MNVDDENDASRKCCQCRTCLCILCLKEVSAQLQQQKQEGRKKAEYVCTNRRKVPGVPGVLLWADCVWYLL